MQKFRSALVAAIRLSGQSSYQRRAPAKASLSAFAKLERELTEFAGQEPQNAEAWQLLSQVEECLLNYARALEYAQRSLELSAQRELAQVKRLALLRQALREWDELLLTPAELQELGSYLLEQGADEEVNGRALTHTVAWLKDRRPASAQQILEALRDRGGVSDFAIYHNVAHG